MVLYTCDIKDCVKNAVVIIEPGVKLCVEHDMQEKIQKGGVVCKFCHTPMISRTNLRPKLGRSHSKRCPRRRMYG